MRRKITLNSKCKDITLETVSTYKYFGCIITNVGKEDVNTNDKARKSRGVYYALNRTILRKGGIEPGTT